VFIVRTIRVRVAHDVVAGVQLPETPWIVVAKKLPVESAANFVRISKNATVIRLLDESDERARGRSVFVTRNRRARKTRFSATRELVSSVVCSRGIVDRRPINSRPVAAARDIPGLLTGP